MFRGPLVILGVLLIILALHGRSTQYGLLQIVPNSSKRQLLNWSRKVQGFLQKLVGENILIEASRARSHSVSSESWYKQSDPGNKNIERIAEARKYYERIILNNIG